MTANKWVEYKWNNTNVTVYDKLRELESVQFHLLYRGQEASKLKGGEIVFVNVLHGRSQHLTEWCVLLSLVNSGSKYNLLNELFHRKTYNLDWHHNLLKWRHKFAGEIHKL